MIKLDIIDAQLDDLAEIENLLTSSGLPTEGVAEHLDTALVVKEGNSVIGSALLEIYGHDALLRSVAVAAEHRHHGIGNHLIHDILILAERRAINNLYLLTETAKAFFAALGFREIDRDEVPDSVQQSVEFQGLCPEGAQAMVKKISNR